MESRETTGGLVIEGRIEKRVHSVEQLREQCDDWDNLTREEKLEASREVKPVTEEVTYNVTTDRFHEYFVDNLDPAQTSAEDNLAASWMGLGNDAGSGTSTSDTDLNNRVYSETVTDHADNGKELLASTFVDSTEANGYTVDEIGLFTGDPANLTNADVFLINHSTFADILKDSSKTVTFDVTLTFSDV